ncbi:MAG: putative RNA 3'-terminal phosphate cyclase family protein, partial [Streblomastix strix]
MFADGGAIRVRGSACIRQAIIYSILSQRHVVIEEIRSFEQNVGLKGYEDRFLELIKKIMEGCLIKINVTGTQITFIPGILKGGDVEFDCGNERGIGYYLEAIMALAPFSKERLNCTLYGATNVDIDHGGDPSVDALKDCALPILQKFGVLAELELNIKRRSTHETEPGEIYFTCPAVKQLKSINWRDPGFIKKVRGISFSVNRSRDMVNQMIFHAKGVLLKFIPDVRIDAPAP